MEVKSIGFSDSKIISKSSRIATTEETEKVISKIIQLVKGDEKTLKEKGIDITLVENNNEEIEIYKLFKRDLVNITRIEIKDSKNRIAVLYIILNVFNVADKFSDDSESHTFYSEIYQEYPTGELEEISGNDLLELMHPNI